MKTNNFKKGFTLIELLIGFIAIIFLMILVFSIYNKVNFKSKSKDIYNKIILASTTYDNLAKPVLFSSSWSTGSEQEKMRQNNIYEIKSGLKSLGIIELNNNEEEDWRYGFNLEGVNRFGGLVKLNEDSITFEDIPLEACNYIAVSLSAYLSDTKNGVMTNCFTVIKNKANEEYGEDDWNPFEGQDENLEYTDISFYFADKTLNIINSNFRPIPM